MPEERKIPAGMAEFFAKMQAIKAKYGAEMHKAVTLYEDLPCYPVEKVLKLFELEGQIMRGAEEERDAVAAEHIQLLNSIEKKPDAPEAIYLWPEGKVPTLTEYTDKATIKAVQAAMNELGFECGTPDGVSGKKTAAAISAFARDVPLPVPQERPSIKTVASKRRAWSGPEPSTS